MSRTIAQLLTSGVETLRAGSASPRLDAEVLLASLLALPRPGLIAHGEQCVPHEREQAYLRLLAQRLQGTPVAYLTGVREFWSLPLKVSPAVLVPRPETELLVELALELLAQGRDDAVLDLGTGSGAIALALAKERPRARIVATDVSAAALEVARENARALALTNIEWRQGSWFDAIPGRRFYLILANPPYIAAGDPALSELSAEPDGALSSGPTGLEALEAISAGAAGHLAPHGALLLEHGAEQAAAVCKLLQRHGFIAIGTHRDLSGRPRVSLGRLHLA